MDKGSPVDAKNVEECLEAQTNEAAALQAIFMQDFEEISSTHFKIKLTPYPSQEKNNFSSVTLSVGYTPDYPNTPAIVHLERSQGLTERQFNELSQLVAQQNEINSHQERIFDLTQIICEYLQVHNKEPLSLHDEMERRRVVNKSEGDFSSLDEDVISVFGEDTEVEEDVGYGLTSIFDDNGSEVLNMSAELENSQIKWMHKNLIGTGPNGEVYAGINTITQTPIVIKEIVYESSSSAGDSNDVFEVQCALMAKEIDSMAHLKHPNLVRYLACEREGNVFRIFQEPIAFSNVKEMSYPSSSVPSLRAFPTRSALDEGTIRKYTRQILHALLYLHTHHVAHHNLKCTNILVEDKAEGRILLSDYGGHHRKLYDYLQDVRGSKNAHYYMGHHSSTSATTDSSSAQEVARKDDVYHLALCIISMAGGDEGGSGEVVPEHLSRAAKEFIHSCLKRDAHERPEVANLLKHPFVTQPYVPTLHHAHNAHMTTDSSPPSPSTSSVTSASTTSSFASSNQSQQAHTNVPSSDTSTASTIPPIPTLSRREAMRRDKSANTLTSAFAAARSDDDSSASSASAASSRSSASIPSRYRQDFEEVEIIGRGGFGIVVKARNRLDGRYYAIKKIKIDGSNQALTTKMLREVTTLSRLHHQYVVRYFQAWIERADFTSMAVEGDEDEEDEGDEDYDEGSDDDLVEDLSGSLATQESEDWFEPSGPPSTSAGMLIVGSLPDRIGGDDEDDDDDDDGDDEEDEEEEEVDEEEEDMNGAILAGRLGIPIRGRQHSRGGGGRGAVRGVGRRRSAFVASGGMNRDPQYLYIQMEYCPKKTLRNVIDEGKTEVEDNWYMFRQIIEGLSHIHQQGIIHRDLKPANIFIDDDDSIKIGDFGLATTGPTGRPSISIPAGSLPSPAMTSISHGPIATSPPAAFARDDSWTGMDSVMARRRGRERSMTGGVGTYLYCCPELLHRSTKHYGVKVDMYSAGIIFFEMWQPFSTEMERASTLNALRSRLEFPVGFEAAHPLEANVIRMLLQHDPDQRPDTLYLLKSDLLPTRMEEEILKEAIKTIANPNQDRLFSIPTDDHILQTYHYAAAPFSPAHTALRDTVFARLRHIFRLHGALSVETPLLLPKHSKLAENALNTVQLLDAGGVLVALPFDLTFPWARYVAQHRLTSAKRYSLCKVYRKSLPGSAPRELWECDFDIVGSSQHHVSHECEVILTMAQILDEYSQELGPYTIAINNFQLLTAVLEVCEVPRALYSQVLSLLSQVYRTSWAEVAAVLRVEVSARCANMLEPYFSEVYPPGSINLQLDRLAKLLARHRVAQLAISSLRSLARHLAAVGVLPKAFIDLSLVYHPGYYDGLQFQAILLKGKGGKQEVVMAGGRYDGLVRMFAQEGTSSDKGGGVGGGGGAADGASTVGAVGMNIAVEKIVTAVLGYEQRRVGRPTHSQQTYQQDVDVVVCSIGSALTEEKMSVAAVLWAANVRADFIPFESTSVEELAAVCRERKIPWIITLKDRSYNMRGVVRLRNVETRAEMDLSRKEVAAVILQRGGVPAKYGSGNAASSASEEVAQTPAPGPTHSHTHANTHAIVFSNVEIVVLHDETRGRANRKIIIQAQQDMSRVLRALSPNALAKVACVDLPAQVCREVVANFDTSVVSPAPLVKGDRVIQQRVASLKNLLTKWKSFPIVFIYSYRDSKYVALAM